MSHPFLVFLPILVACALVLGLMVEFAHHEVNKDPKNAGCDYQIVTMAGCARKEAP